MKRCKQLALALGAALALSTATAIADEEELDAQGRVARVTASDGSWVAYRYDELDRVVAEEYSDGTVRYFWHDEADIRSEVDAGQ